MLIILYQLSPLVRGLGIMNPTVSPMESLLIWSPLVLLQEIHLKMRLTTATINVTITVLHVAIEVANPAIGFHRVLSSVRAISIMARRTNCAPVLHHTVPASSPWPNTPSVIWRLNSFGLCVIVVSLMMVLASISIHTLCGARKSYIADPLRLPRLTFGIETRQKSLSPT